MSLSESSVSVLPENMIHVGNHPSFSSPKLVEKKLEFPIGLIEISGPERFTWTARYLEENSWKAMAWIEENMQALPDEVICHDLPFHKILFIDGKKDCTWAAGTILRSHLFPILIFNAPFHTEKNIKRFRRLSLAAQTTMILLSEVPHFSHYFALQSAAYSKQELTTLRRSRC